LHEHTQQKKVPGNARLLLITPLPPAARCLGGRVTWLSSQWKLRAKLGHFSVAINSQGIEVREGTRQLQAAVFQTTSRCSATPAIHRVSQIEIPALFRQKISNRHYYNHQDVPKIFLIGNCRGHPAPSAPMAAKPQLVAAVRARKKTQRFHLK
jgi:hypothetical protein